MIRVTFVSLAAFAVLWHTTVGCCAHHAHGSQIDGTEAVACCEGKAGHEHEAEPAWHRHDDGRAVDRDSLGRESLQRPHSHGEGCCGAERCAFSLPEGSGAGKLKQAIADGETPPVLPHEGPFGDVSGFATFPSDVGRVPGSPALDGALRRHLALGVLRL